MATSILFRLARATAALAASAASAAVLGGSLLQAGGLASCLTTESYVYTARQYDPAADCLNAYAAVEVVSGSGARSTCRAACLTVGPDLYVSTMCPPLPVIATAVAADAGDCIAALAALKRGGTCDEPGDGGADADGGALDGEAPDGEAPDAGDMDAADDATPINDAGDAG